MPITALYASGETRMSAVSSTCTSRKKKIATPVIRCSTHDHMPSRPRYSVPRGTLEVVSDTEGMGRVPMDTVVLPARCEVVCGRRGPCAGAFPSYDRSTGGGDGCRAQMSRHRESSQHTPDMPPETRPMKAPATLGRMPEPIEDFYAVIPAGGIGSRLWPLSRADAPKFLHDLTGSGHSLLRDTWDRLEPLSGADRIAVVTGRAHRAAVEKELPGIPDMNVFLESEPRDSAAAIGLAAAILSRREPDVIIGSFAADHVIRGTQVFDWAVQQAVAVAREGYICTIGIPPTEPAVGFGYMKKAGELVVTGAPEAALVERFVEKPDLDTAREYLVGPLVPLERRHVHLACRRAVSARSPRTSRTSTPV